MSPMSLLTADQHRDRLRAAWDRSDHLFGLVFAENVHARPISLRHPIVFYIGHLPAFAWNQVGRGALGLPAMDAHLDALFERGIDPADEAQAAAESIHAWPALDTILAYRDRVRAAVLEQVDTIVGRHDPAHPLLRGGRILHVAVEHELMHHETLLYMFQQSPGLLRQPAGAALVSSRGVSAPSVRRVRIPAGAVDLGVNPGESAFYWDNEAPRSVESVAAFDIDHLPVTNARLRAFAEAGGYADDRWWGAWRPVGPSNFVHGADGSLGVRWLFGVADWEDAAQWPAQVSLAEARAFARWSGRRLPTEAELNRAAYATPDGPDGPDGPKRPYPWGEAPVTAARASADFAVWSPAPVGQAPAGASAFGVEELVGNGWEWTDTVWAARPGFAADIPTYPGYTADFFDGDHYVVFGGSWATDRALLRRSFRNWYQPRYPHVFSSFRTVG